MFFYPIQEDSHSCGPISVYFLHYVCRSAQNVIDYLNAKVTFNPVNANYVRCKNIEFLVSEKVSQNKYIF